MFYLYKNGHTPKDYVAHGSCLHSLLDVMKKEIAEKAKQTIDRHNLTYEYLTNQHPLYDKILFDIDEIRNKQKIDNYFVVLFSDKPPLQIMSSFDAMFRDIEYEVISNSIKELKWAEARAKREEIIF